MAVRCGVCGEEHASIAELRRLHPPGSVPDDPSLGAPPSDGSEGDDDPVWDGQPSGWDEARGALEPASPRARSRVALPGRAPSAPSSGGASGARAPGSDGRDDQARAPRSGPLRRAAEFASPGAVGGLTWVVARAETAEPGPDALGRSIVISPGEAVPAAWADTPRVAVALDNLASVRAIGELWWGRRRFVAEVSPSDLAALLAADQWTERRPAYLLGPSWEPGVERLAHYVLANAANLTIAGAVARTGVILDGGPVEIVSLDDGHVMHRIAASAGATVGWGDRASAADLAPDQLAAVAEPRLAARIIAPAGSGKTRVLTERARHLLLDRNLPPSALTLVAFNTRAAEEMRARTMDLTGLRIRTLNALALRIAQAERPNIRTILERDVRAHIDRLVRIPRQRNADPTAAWIDALSAVRLGLVSPARVEQDFGGDVQGFAEFFPKYEDLLTDRGETDFDGQIAAALRLLCTRPDIRSRVRASCRVLCVDEFQDLTPAHLLMVRLLAGPDGAVFGVGDDDQTIYGYNGASPRWLIDFRSAFPGAAEHALEVNYRCPPPVVRAAASLLSHNRVRVEKRIIASPTRADDPSGLVVHRVADPVAATVGAVRDVIDEGTAPADIAVLTRVNATLLPVQIGLVERGIGVVGAVDVTLLERTGIRSCLAWVRLASGRVGPRDLAEAARRPSRKLSPKVLEWIGEQRDLDGVQRLGSRLKADRDREAVEGFATDLIAISRRVKAGATTGEVLRVVRDELGLGAAMESLDSSKRSFDRSSQADDLAALVSLAGLHPEVETFEPWLRDRLGRASDPHGVVLSTVHRVKGLEWPMVVVHDVTDGLMPHRLSEDVEEERRVFHVAITRSRERTVVVGSSASPSPFLDELTRAYDPSSAPPMIRVGTPGARVGLLGGTDTRPRPGSAGTSAGSGRRGASTAAAGEPAVGPVADALRAWRTRRARNDAVPPYVILHNATLDEIVRVQPSSRVALSRVSGMGPAKLDKYGDEIVAVIAAALGSDGSGGSGA